jgi:hypothetical protein
VRERLGLGRRLDELEDALGGKPVCRCGLTEHAAPGSRSITAASPDDYPDLDPPEGGRWGRVIYEPCPDCGLERLVYVTYMFGEPASPDRH